MPSKVDLHAPPKAVGLNNGLNVMRPAAGGKRILGNQVVPDRRTVSIAHGGLLERGFADGILIFPENL
jgi:hypothetical protein